MTEANILVALDESKAYWDDSEFAGLLPDGTIVREWRNLPVQSRIEILAELRSRRVEANPKAQTKAYAGTYRIQKIEDIVVHNKQGGTDSLTVRETLAFGLATTLDDATQVMRMPEDTDIPGAGTTWPESPAHTGTSPVESPSRLVTLRWVNIDPNALEAINTAQVDVTASSLIVNGETKTGPWYNTKRHSGQLEDGSGFYEETWSLDATVFESVEAVGDMEITAHRFIQGVPKNLVSATLQSEIAALGANYRYAGFTYTQKVYWRGETADIMTTSTDTLGKDVTRKSDVAAAYTIDEHTYKHAHTLPDADSIVGHTFGQGKTMSVDGDITNDGDFDYKHKVRTAIKQVVALHYQNRDKFSDVQHTKGSNLYDADLTGSFVDLPAQTVGAVATLNRRLNDDGTYESDLTTETGKYALSSGSFATRYGTVYWWSVKNAVYGSDATTADSWLKLVSDATLTSATDNHAQYEYNRFGLVDGTIIKRPVIVTASTPGWTLGTISTVHYKSKRMYKQAKNKSWMYKDIVYTETITGHATFAAANAELEAGSYALRGTPAGNSRVEKINDANWYAYKITSDEASASWVTDYDLS